MNQSINKSTNLILPGLGCYRRYSWEEGCHWLWINGLINHSIRIVQLFNQSFNQSTNHFPPQGTDEQIADAIDAIRGKKDVVALAKRLKYFFGAKTVNYGVREVTNQRTDAAKVVIKCFCIETRGFGETGPENGI